MTAVETIGVNGSDKSNISLTSILIVDNDPETNQFIQSKLKDLYTLVEAVENIENAEILLQRCHFDLIIVDVSNSDNSLSDNSRPDNSPSEKSPSENSRPDKTALQWINSMRDQGDEVGVIFLAADTDLETAVGALRVGAADFIFKPVDQEQMLNAVKNFFEHKKVKRENFVLKRQIDHIFDHSGIVGDCEAINSVCQVIKRIAPMPSTVLIEGESGTGKELAARAIHRWSHRTGSFVPINCGAMSAELLESELFGHTKGAFTGANQAREGLFSYANHGTLFLDEIGEMPLPMQAHLLRVLEERKIRAVGSNREIALDVRIIAASNKDLKEQVSKGVFREDLYYRLNVLAVRIPSLRERMDDIPLLAQHFISTLSVQLGIQAPVYEQDQFSQLKQYAWPGNVRELKNVIERCLLLNTDPQQCLPGLSAGQAPITEDAPQSSQKLEHIEKSHILKILEQQSGNKSAASRVLGISRKTLERKVQLWKGG